jgi:hypothetical protein
MLEDVVVLARSSERDYRWWCGKPTDASSIGRVR